MSITKKVKNYVIGTIAGLSLMASCSSVYTISETEQAVITKFGKPTHIVLGSDVAGEIDSVLIKEVEEWNKQQKEPVETVTAGAGVHFKIPFVESVTTFEDRILEYDSAPTEVVTKDKKHLFVDNYARWRITNPLKFMKSAVTENGAQSRLDDIIYSVVREYAGQNNLIELVRSTNTMEKTTEIEFENIEVGREKVMKYITELCNQKADEYGIEIIDVRIKRADLPVENAKSVYNRMIAERNRIATKYRSQGEEEATKIRAETDRQRTEILSSAYEKAEKTRGEGDAKALEIYANAYSKNPKFYNLWRTLESYPVALDGAKVIMSTETDFNKYLKGPRK